MKFNGKMKEIKSKEENKGKIVLVRCGIFFVAIAEDAMLLHELFDLKLTCFEDKICKIGIPVSYVLKYLVLIEEKGYGYVVYDYSKETKSLSLKYEYDGIKANDKKEKCKKCEECPYYKNSKIYKNIDIYELLERRKEGTIDNQNEQ